MTTGTDPSRHAGSNRERVAALVAAGLQDGAARTGPHPRAEAVGLGPLSLIWLVGALHRILISRGKRVTAWSPGDRRRHEKRQVYPRRFGPQRETDGRCMVSVPEGAGGCVGASFSLWKSSVLPCGGTCAQQ